MYINLSAIALSLQIPGLKYLVRMKNKVTIYPRVYLSIRRGIYLSIRECIYLSAGVSIYPQGYLSIRECIYPSASVSMYPQRVSNLSIYLWMKGERLEIGVTQISYIFILEKKLLINILSNKLVGFDKIQLTTEPIEFFREPYITQNDSRLFIFTKFKVVLRLYAFFLTPHYFLEYRAPRC